MASYCGCVISVDEHVYDFSYLSINAVVQVYIFATTPDDGSFYRKQIEEKAHAFIDLPRDWSDSRCADAIAKCKLDVLIDFNGHTCGERLAIQALRPAPVQVAYLGFPGVIGANFIDFNVADPTVVPPQDLEPYHPESVVYMPHCYQINSFRELYQSRKQGVTWQRKDFGLPDRTFVMCTFNRLGRYLKIISQTLNSPKLELRTTAGLHRKRLIVGCASWSAFPTVYFGCTNTLPLPHCAWWRMLPNTTLRSRERGWFLVDQ